MDKTSDQVTKDPRSVEQGKKTYESLMERLKENILEDNQLPTPSTSSSTCDLTPSTSSSTCDTYIYGVGMLAILVIGACVFFAFNAFPKKQANERKINHQNDDI